MLAETRGDARALCGKWLGWDDAEAFRTDEQLSLFFMGGGSVEFPVIFSADRVTWEVVREVRDVVPAGC